jgi:6-phosphogluconolactonase/glucosamine-6-phosphate isomerase/deaminase
MCLPTGRTPEPVYRRVAKAADFSRSTVFLLDEFGLPAGDPARCDRMLQQSLFDRLATPPSDYHRLDPDTPEHEQECARFAELLAEDGLDLVLLGLGGNGHLGLNEPGSEPDSPTRVVELAATTRQGMRSYGAVADTDWGMTTGLKELLAGREVWLLVSGDHKREILRRFLEEPVGADLPATWLREHDNCVVWADEAAAGP